MNILSHSHWWKIFIIALCVVVLVDQFAFADSQNNLVDVATFTDQKFNLQPFPANLTMRAGDSAIIQVTMKNCCSDQASTWTPGRYALVSQVGSTWGRTSNSLPYNVFPNDNIAFAFVIQAPSTASTYPFQWSMSGPNGTFGQPSPRISITVTGGAPPPAPVPSPNPSPSPVPLPTPLPPPQGSSPSMSFSYSGIRLITPGTTKYFYWSTSNLTNPSCTAASSPLHNQWSGAKAVLGYGYPVSNITKTTTFYLTCRGTNATLPTASFTIIVIAQGPLTPGAPAPQITKLSFDRNPIYTGQPTTITWQAINTYNTASTCTAIDGDLNKWPGTKAASGSLPITGYFSDSYSLLCQGPGGSDSTYVWLQVNSPPSSTINDATLIQPSQVPATMAAGQTYTVSMTFKNCRSTGDCSNLNTWTSGGSTPYLLGTQNSPSNLWSKSQQSLPANIPPTQLVTIPFAVTAPSVPGCCYHFKWRMYQLNSSGIPVYFGDTSDYIINVTPPPPTADIRVNNQQDSIDLPYYSLATLSWCGNSPGIPCANATSCTVSHLVGNTFVPVPGWNTLRGSQSLGNITSADKYALSCTGLGGTTVNTVNINITFQFGVDLKAQPTYVGELIGGPFTPTLMATITNENIQNATYKYQFDCNVDDDGPGDPTLLSPPSDSSSISCSYANRGTYTASVLVTRQPGNVKGGTTLKIIVKPAPPNYKEVRPQ